MKEITREQLASFDGNDGRPAYVVVNGVVYDVTDSKLWKGGQHMRRHGAGHDLSAEILLAPHGESVLEKVSRVGMLQGSKPDGSQSTRR